MKLQSREQRAESRIEVGPYLKRNILFSALCSLLSALTLVAPGYALTASNEISITDTSGSAQTNRPVSISRPFKQGEIAGFAQAAVNGQSVLTQCDVKNRWPDGSLKFAIVSFVIPNLPASGSVTISFSGQGSGNNTGFLTQADMLNAAYDFDGRIELNSGSPSVSARAMLQNGHFRYWLQGPIVTAVIIEDRSFARADDIDTGDGSKALHPIFEAWFYPQNKRVDVGFTLENTWASSILSRSMRDMSYSVALKTGSAAPATRFTQSTFIHIGRSRWTKRFWVGGDPGTLHIDHNLRYLVTTKAIPNYDTALSISPALVNSYISSWQGKAKTLDGDALGIGSYSKGLGAAGANDWIGLIPTWDTIYLMTMDDRMLDIAIGNAELAGRIPWHFREADSQAGTGHFFDAVGNGSVDTMGRTISVNARRTVTLGPENYDYVCGASWVGDLINNGPIDMQGWVTTRDHMPDIAYLAYLLTGRYYFLEQLQYQASFIVAHHIGCTDLPGNRQADAGYLNDSQLRGEAWGFRTLAYGAFLSPDGSPEKAYYEDKMANNIARMEGNHDIPLSNPAKLAHWTWGKTHQFPSIGISPLGAWDPGSAGDVQGPLKTDGTLAAGSSPWETNFLMIAFGMAKQFGYGTNALLKFMAREQFNILLNPATIPYLIETYRYPTQPAATHNWILAWSDFASYYATLPTGWSLDSTADHGYGFIALAGLSFLTDQTADGYSGQTAWNFYRANKAGLSRFATESPKWDIVAPATGAPPPPPPPNSSHCDVNGDNATNAQDIQLVANHILLGDNAAAYDINRDGVVNVLDLQQEANVLLAVTTCP